MMNVAGCKAHGEPIERLIGTPLTDACLPEIPNWSVESPDNVFACSVLDITIVMRGQAAGWRANYKFCRGTNLSSLDESIESLEPYNCIIITHKKSKALKQIIRGIRFMSVFG